MNSCTIAVLLKELIMEYNRVSLPCLGSFLSEYSPAVISEGTIYPPSKAVVFHQNEIWNDEKLENHIALINNISIGVAKEELAFWIDNICVLLATGEEVLLPGLGRLYVSKQAQLMFEQESDNLLLESFGLEPVDIQINGLTENELDELVDVRDKEKEKENHKSGVKGLIVGILIITTFAVAAILAIFGYILTDNKSTLPPSEIPAKSPATELNYEEYFVPKYGIVLSSFDKMSDARDFSKNIAGTSIHCIDSETPYHVIFSYPTRESSDKAIDNLKRIYSGAYIIELSTNKSQ
ncbi:MAG: hypothetical protein LBF59_03820 [Prevotellaceae bacterium]|jgi:hypothetical protein|nr:hypothetical protein [Prevotellaceae bacterium]